MPALSNMSALVGNNLWQLNGEFQYDFNATPNSVLEVLQNVYEIFSTPLGSQPLQRAFGMDTSWIDLPGNLATMTAQTAFLLAVSVWEPRAVFSKIQFSLDPTSVAAGVYSLYCELTINLDAALTLNVFGAPGANSVWVVDSPMTGVEPTVSMESLTL